MHKKEFVKIRYSLEKSQAQMAQLLGLSAKAVQSFEQGWRNIPVHVERQLLFLLSLKQNADKKEKPCWVVRKCPKENRSRCPTWEFRASHLCWFINGTICHGEVQKDWKNKLKLCRRCKVFQRMILP